MADRDHLAKFGEGLKAWNAWRDANPGVTPDLRELAPALGEKQFGPAHGGPIDLRDALLNEAQLHGATLIAARLDNADLRRADLSKALLTDADLSFANLSGAIFDDADLANADLRGAIVEGARLHLARNLTQEQIQTAQGDASTSLPPDLAMPGAWLAADGFDYELGDEFEEEDLDAEPHKLLGLPPKPSADEIRIAYRTLAKKYHPDVNPGDMVAERRFMSINQAYRQLTAPKRQRAKPTRRQAGVPWAAALALFALAFAAPSLALYWLDLPPFNAKQTQISSFAEVGEEPSAPQDGHEDRSAPIEPSAVTNALPAQAAEESAPAAAAEPEPPALASATDITDETTGSSAVAAAPQDAQDAEDTAPETVASQIAAVQEQNSERIKTAADVNLPLPTAVTGLITGGDQPSQGAQLAARSLIGKTSGETDIAASGSSEEAQPLARVAALQPAAPTPAEVAVAPWDEEWQTLRDSPELLALHDFIRRYPGKPPADEARMRFRDLVAGFTDLGALKSFVGRTVEDTPETALAKRQLARLVERETAESDEKAWNDTIQAGTLAAFRAYLLSYPGGRYANEAEEKLAALEKQYTGRRNDDAAWAKARGAGTRAAFEAYLKAHPQGRNVTRAREKLASLANSEAKLRKEDEAWAKAKKADKPRDYYAYLNAYPDGRYAALAQRSIEKAERPVPAESPRAVSEVQKPLRSEPLRWPSSDEPFVERIP